MFDPTLSGVKPQTISRFLVPKIITTYCKINNPDICISPGYDADDDDDDDDV